MHRAYRESSSHSGSRSGAPEGDRHVRRRAYGVVNLVSSDSLPKLSLSADRRVDHAELVVNARVAIDPTDLTRVIEDTLQTLAAEQKMRLTVRAIQSFRPGRPVPTHRLTDAASSI